MELNDDNYESYDKYLNNSDQYLNKIKELDGGINILLDEFKKVYVIVKMNPASEEYQQKLEDLKNNLATILSQSFIISNDVQVNTNNINKQLFKLDFLIRQERERNKELKTQLGMIENTGNASSEMISDYKTIYNYNYLRNWSLLLSSLLCLGVISILYKPPRV